MKKVKSWYHWKTINSTTTLVFDAASYDNDTVTTTTIAQVELVLYPHLPMFLNVVICSMNDSCCCVSVN